MSELVDQIERARLAQPAVFVPAPAKLWDESRNTSAVRGPPAWLLPALLRELRAARESRAEWYVWIVQGMPTLSADEYARVGRNSRGKARANSRGLSSGVVRSPIRA